MSEEPVVGVEQTGRVVVGVDGSDVSLRALEWAAHQCELTHASLEVVAVWEWPIGLGWTMLPAGYNPEQDTQKWLQSVVDGLHVSHAGVSISQKVFEGHPAQVLVRESRGAELLVVGSRGHGEFVGMLIGSTSEHCVTNALCPVVVVRDRADG